FGLVVLSPHFLAKRWPEYELRGLTAREIVGTKVILPVWRDVEHADVLKFSPPLADKVAIQATGRMLEEIAVSIIKIIRPDILTRIHRRAAFLRALQNSR